MDNVHIYIHEFTRNFGSAQRIMRAYKTVEHINPFLAGKAFPGKFVPEYSTFFRKVVDVNKAHYIYFKPDVSQMKLMTLRTDMNSYSDIYYNLNYCGINLGLYKFTVNGKDHHLIIGRQLIMDMEGTVLFLGVCRGYQHTLQPEDRRMYIASEFYTDDTYKYFVKKFESEYIDGFRKEGVEIVSKSSQVIEDEYFGESVVKKISQLSHFEQHKEDLRYHVQRMIDSADNESRQRMKIASGYDAFHPSPILPGYTARNLKAKVVDPQPWNQDWGRKFLYLTHMHMIKYKDMIGMNLEEFIEKIHAEYNPSRIFHMIELFAKISDLFDLKYDPNKKKFLLFTHRGDVEIQLSCVHWDEYVSLMEEFDSVENVTFVNEETSTQESDEVSEEAPEDEVNEVSLDNGTTINALTGETHAVGPDGTRWQITSNNVSFTPSNYTMGVDAYNDGDDRTNPGIMERIRQAGNTFMASQSQDFRVSDLADSQIRQYPVTPSETYLFEDLDADEERPEASNEDTPIDELPVWANEENFTHNS